MIKAIIFDCFGVLATDDWLPFKERHFGSDPDLFRRATEVNQQANAGLVSYENFVHEVAVMAKTTDSTVQKALRHNKPNAPLFDYIRTLKRRYKIGFLSNSASDWLSDIFTKEQIDLFDTVVLSYRFSSAKPDPKIYKLTASRLDAQPEECVFVDDQERYALAAERVGMKGIYYQDFSQMKRELEKVLAS
jgi:HAD superfamily hydrolase (TIGR01509 family)